MIIYDRRSWLYSKKKQFFIVEKKSEILSVSDKHDPLVLARCHVLRRKGSSQLLMKRVYCSFVQFKIKPFLTKCTGILTYRAGSLALSLKYNHFSHVYHQIRRSGHQLDITGGARASFRSARASARANSGSAGAVIVGDVSFVSRRGLTFCTWKERAGEKAENIFKKFLTDLRRYCMWSKFFKMRNETTEQSRQKWWKYLWKATKVLCQK
jgi:hypothetical protein